ncbi:MAG: trigger factor [Clostridia bacterium]|nr:trigger factor [Clostridia bacterium]
MNLKENNKTDKNTVELVVEVKGDEFKAAVDAAFKKNIKKMTVPGFRKGKAPRKMVEKLYGEGVFYDDAINALYPAAYDAAVSEAGISPVDNPAVEVTSVDSEGFEFKAKVTVKPEVEVKDYKGIKAVKNVYNVTETMVKSEIEALRKQNQRIVDVDREAKSGDTVNIDYEGSVDGVPFDGGKADGYDLSLGSNTFIPGFEDQLIGKKAGDECEVNVTFPEEYHAQELKGKAAVFKVKVNTVKEIQLPDADDEFAKDVSEFDTLAELKADIKKKLKEQKNAQSESELESALVDKLLENTEVEIPAVMISRKVDSMMAEFEQRLAGSGLNLNTYIQYMGTDLESFKKNYESEAQKQVKTRLALEKIVELEKIVVSDEDTDKEYQMIADAYKMKLEDVKRFVPAEEITMDVAVGKAVELIKNNAEITEQKQTAKKTAAKKTAAKKPADEKEAE